jgi:hypothetical protein
MQQGPCRAYAMDADGALLQLGFIHHAAPYRLSPA